MREREKGFIPVMLTPFKSNGNIDFDELAKLTAYYLEAGAAGLFANCLSSEMFELDEQESLQLVEHVVTISNGIIPVVATGTFGGPISKQADYIKRIYDKGVDAVILITSLLAEENDSEVRFNSNVFELFELTEQIPLGFYECPVPYKRVLSPHQLGQFVDTGRIIYHKDTCLNLEAVRAKNIRCANNDKFGLYDAYMAHAVDSLKAGSAGLSCIQGNFFPELVVWLCKNYDKHELHEEMMQVQKFFIDEMDVMHNVYPVIAKYYLQKQGLNISTFTRRNDVGIFNNEVKNEVDKLGLRYQRLLNSLEVAKLSK